MTNKKVHEKLEKEALFSILSETEKMANVGGWEWVIDTDIWTFSDNWLHIHGCSKRHLTSSELLPIGHPDDRHEIQKAFDRAVVEGVKYEIEHRIIRQDTGEERYIRASGKPLLDGDGKVVKIIGLAQDITELKQAELELIKSENRYRDLGQSVNSAIIRYQSDGTITYFNEYAQTFFGYSIEEVIGENIDILLPEKESTGMDLTRLVQDIVDHPHRHINKINENICSDGQHVWMSWTNKAFKDSNGLVTEILTVGNDITEQKKAEEKLKESEKKFHTILNQSPFPIAVVDINDEKILYWSQSAIKILGHNPSNVSEWYELAYPDPEYREEVIKRWKPYVEKALKSNRAINGGEYKVVCKDGTTKNCEIYAQFIPDNLIVTLNDITERKNAEDILKINEHRYKVAQSMGKVGNWEYDLVTERFWGSDEAKRIYGFDPGGKTFSADEVENCIPERERVHQALIDLIEHDRPYDLEFEIHPVSGPKQKFIKSIAKLEKDSWGMPHKVLGVVQDITQQKEHESSLKAIEWLLEESPTVISASSQEYSDLTELNTCRMILDNIGKDMLSDIVAGYLELLETSSAVYEKNGDYAHGIFSSGWCRMMDSASRKLCNTPNDSKALNCGKWLCHESCWSNASKTAIDTGQPVDIQCEGGIRLYAIPITTHDQVIGAINFGYGDPPKDAATLEAISKKFQVDINDLIRESDRYEHRPNFIIETAKKRLQSSAKLIGAIVESKVAQTKFQQEQERLDVTLQSIGDAVITTDIQGKVVLINKVAQTLTGWCREDAYGRNLFEVFEIINEQTQKPCENPVEKVLETKEVVELANHTVLIARDGSRRVIADSAAPIIDTSDNIIGVVLVFRDMTEKVELETALRHAHKMEAIGNLAGGIAHEFNNMLAIIMGNNELITEDLPQGSLAREGTEEIRIAGLRAREVVKQLLTFSRQDDAVKKIMDLKLVVQESIQLIRSTTPVNIKIEQNLLADTCPVMGNGTQINQLLLNLCNNAVDALPEKDGLITIELKNETIDIEQTQYQSKLKPGQYAKLMVSDNGSGMDSATLDRVFEPYFTTKDMGKGTGIGMAVAHGIVEKHGGMIIADSNPGQGTTFTIFLPIHEGLFERETDEQDAPPVGEECVLYVDDEPSLATLGKRLLERLGYTAVSITDPVKALDMVRADPNKFDLLITDMAMPGMTGDQLVIETLKIRQDMPTIICTGYSAKISEKEAAGIGVRSFIMKPIITSELAKMVRKVLDEAKLSNLEKG